jgi:hypothetical protein
MNRISAFRVQNQPAARPRGQHHQAHDAFPVHLLAVFLHENVARELIRSPHEERGRTSMNPQFVDYNQLFGYPHVFIFGFPRGAHLLDTLTPVPWIAKG